MSLELLIKPNLLVAGDGRLGPEGATAYGTSLAAAYAAGLAARSLGTGTTAAVYWKALEGRSARVLKIP
jgi:hypothetical protein